MRKYPDKNPLYTRLYGNNGVIMQKIKLMDQIKLKLKLKFKHYSPNTIKVYLYWIKKFILFHNKRHPKEMGKPEIEQFLSHLAAVRKIAASTQNQAFNAILFLYNQVLELSLDGHNINALRAKQRIHLPIVLSKSEVLKILNCMPDAHSELILKTIYGCGLRLKEVLNLRIKDIDFAYNRIIVWDSKSMNDRSVPLPQKIHSPIQQQIHRVSQLHQEDINQGFGSVSMPFALARKFPQAAYETKWQYLFPMKSLSNDPESGIRRRHHILSSHFSRKLKQAVNRSLVNKKVTAHTFRHSYAKH